MPGLVENMQERNRVHNQDLQEAMRIQSEANSVQQDAEMIDIES